MSKILIAAAVALVIGIVIGFIAGRTMLERQWSQPYAAVSAAEEKFASGDDANPSPKAGAKILSAMPIGRARIATRDMTEKDPVVVEVGSVGSGDEGLELHLTLKNRGSCSLKSAAGVAYGFDASGKPAALNKGGVRFVAWSGDAAIEPGQSATITQKIKNADLATLALAHVDKTTCANGTTWARQ